MTWIARLLRRSRMERDLDRELRFHLDAAIADNLRSGMTPAEAERRARIDLGGMEQVKEDARDARGTRWVEDMIADARYALRAMRRAPVFSAAAILTLALGIGANVSVWRIIDALVRRSLPIERPEQLHALKAVGIEDGRYSVSRPNLLALREALPDSNDLAGMSSIMQAYVTLGEQPERVLTQLVTGNWFRLLGVRSQIGRVFTADDDMVQGGHPVAVITERFWERRFARDPAVIGRSMRVNGTIPVTIIGVTQRSFDGLTVGTPIDVFVPSAMQHELRLSPNATNSNASSEKPWMDQVGMAWLIPLTRVNPAEVDGLTARLGPAYRASIERAIGTGDSASLAFRMRERLVLEPLSRGFSFVRTQFGEPLRALMVGVSLILLIACANLAGLLMARGAVRSHETAVRLSLGARRGRLVRQALTESLTLAAVGGLAGVLLSQWLTAALLKLGSAGTRAIPLDVSVRVPTILFALGVSVATGLLFGIAPAVRMSRGDLYETFRRGSRGVTGHRVPLGRMLVVAQIALSLILVASAGVFVRTFENMVNIDPGYDRETVVLASIDVRAAGYTTEQLPALYDALLASVRTVPGVQSVSMSFLGLARNAQIISSYSVPGRSLPGLESQGHENIVSPGFFATTGIPVIKGRGFTDADAGNSPRVVVVTEKAAKRFFGGVDSALGKRLGYDEPIFEVVGVVRDIRAHELRSEPPPMLFHALAQRPRTYINSIEIRVAGVTEPVIAGIRSAIGTVDKNLPIREVAALESVLTRSLTRERLIARLAGAFGILALLLAAIGMYGVISYSVARRTNEMGVRLALGASPAGVSWVVINDSLRTIAIGLAVGIVLWFPLLGLTRQLVYGLSPHDPATLGVSTTLLLLTGGIAALLPAMRAARIDPIEAIRSE